MKVPVFCAGALQVRWSYFIVVVLAARAMRYLALAYLGVHYGHRTYVFLLSHGRLVALIVIALALLSIVLLQLIDRRRGNDKPAGVKNASVTR